MKMAERQTGRLVDKINIELGPTIVAALNDDEVVEIMLNPDGNIWVDSKGGMKKVGTLDAGQAMSAVKTIASFSCGVLTRDDPILSCELPVDGSRFQAVIPPVVPQPSFTIRKKASVIYTLQDYVSQGALADAERHIIVDAVCQYKNIVVAGSTGSGKTTLTNAIIYQIVQSCPGERLVIIEDTNEIQCSAENSVILRSNDKTSLLDLIKNTMRYRPDRILIGEVRGKEAWPLLKAWNTGHPGGVVTVHANSARATLQRLEQLSSESDDSPKNLGFLKQQVGETVDMVIFIEKITGRRKITQIMEVNGYDSDNHNYKIKMSMEILKCVK